MFMLYMILCSGLVGSPGEQCNDYVVDGPFTVYDCGRAIARHPVRNETASLECRRLTLDGEPWNGPHVTAQDLAGE